MFAFHTWARISISGSALSVVVILMLDGWVSANHGDEGNADEQHHNHTCYLRQSVERRRINVTGLNCTTFLKALYIQQPDLTHLTVSLCGYGFRVLPKKKTRSMAGFVKMGDRKLVEQPTAILLMIGLTNKDRGPYRLIRRAKH